MSTGEKTKRPPPQERRCQRNAGTERQCRAARMKGSELCFFHDPVIRTHREDLIKLNEVPLHRSQDLHRLLARAVKAVERKKINPQQAYAMGWLVQLLLQTSQGVEKEKSYHESQSYGMLYRDLYLKLRGGEKMPEDEYGPDSAEDAERLWMKEGG
jgi:hypothetical protein